MFRLLLSVLAIAGLAIVAMAALYMFTVLILIL